MSALTYEPEVADYSDKSKYLITWKVEYDGGGKIEQFDDKEKKAKKKSNIDKNKSCVLFLSDGRQINVEKKSDIILHIKEVYQEDTEIITRAYYAGYIEEDGREHRELVAVEDLT